MTYDFFLIFLSGLFIGTAIGVFIMCIVISGRTE